MICWDRNIIPCLQVVPFKQFLVKFTTTYIYVYIYIYMSDLPCTKIPLINSLGSSLLSFFTNQHFVFFFFFLYFLFIYLFIYAFMRVHEFISYYVLFHMTWYCTYHVWILLCILYLWKIQSTHSIFLKRMSNEENLSSLGALITKTCWTCKVLHVTWLRGALKFCVTQPPMSRAMSSHMQSQGLCLSCAVCVTPGMMIEKYYCTTSIIMIDYHCVCQS